MSERSMMQSSTSLVPEPSVSEVEAMSERSERSMMQSSTSLVPEPSVSEEEA